MPATKRTEGPWHVAPYPGHVTAGRDRLVAGCRGYADSSDPNVHDENDANAAFIVEACNAYDDHVGLLDNYRSTLQSMEAQRGELQVENARLREALELIAGKGWSSLCVEHAAEEMHAMAVSALGKVVE